MWSEQATFYEGEDEAALRDEFARLVAKYPQQDPYQIAHHVFKKLKDPFSRSQQACMNWMADVEVLELITRYRRGEGDGVATKEEAFKLAWAIANGTVAATKEQVAALKLFGEMQGLIVKQIDKVVDDKTTKRAAPQIVFARYAD